MELLLDLIFLFCVASLATFTIALVVNATQRRRAKAKSASEAAVMERRAVRERMTQEAR